MKYRPEIDGLRTVAVVPVLLFHAGFSYFRGGFVGVDVFFVISGYLITSILLRELAAEHFSLVDFYERRARRILPALFVVLAATLPFAWLWLMPDQLAAFGRSLGCTALFISNLCLRSEQGYFGAVAEEKPLLHTWSLAVEEQFYLLFPVILYLLWKDSRKHLLLACLALAATSLFFAEWTLGAPGAAPKVFFDSHARAWELLLGSGVAVLGAKGAIHFSPLLHQLGSLLGLAMIVFSALTFGPETPSPGAYLLMPTVGAALVILFASPVNFVGKLLSMRVAVGLGLISYSVYLWHQPLFVFTRLRSLREPGPFAYGLLVALSFVLGYLSWRYVETPFRDRQRMSRSFVFKFSGVASLVTLALGALLFWEQGLPARFAGAEQAQFTVPRLTRGAYVGEFFMSRNQPGELAANKARVVIVGDSFAQDLTNALREAQLLETEQVRTVNVPLRCQIYLGRADPGQVPRGDRRECRERWNAMKAAAAQADLLILASKWQEWSVQQLPATLDQLGLNATQKVFVFGSKSFGRINLFPLLRLAAENRVGLRNEISSEIGQIDERLAVLAPDRFRFVSQHEILCGRGQTQCPLFTPQGKLLSYDGDHLTQAGAQYLGARLGEIQDLRLALGSDPASTAQTK